MPFPLNTSYAKCLVKTSVTFDLILSSEDDPEDADFEQYDAVDDGGARKKV